MWQAHTWRFLPIGPGLSDLLPTLNKIPHRGATARPTKVGDVLVVSGLEDVSSLDRFIENRQRSYLDKLMDYLLSKGQNQRLSTMLNKIQSEDLFNAGQKWRPREDTEYFQHLFETSRDPDPRHSTSFIMPLKLDRHFTGYDRSVDRQR